MAALYASQARLTAQLKNKPQKRTGSNTSINKNKSVAANKPVNKESSTSSIESLYESLSDRRRDNNALSSSRPRSDRFSASLNLSREFDSNLRERRATIADIEVPRNLSASLNRNSSLHRRGSLNSDYMSDYTDTCDSPVSGCTTNTKNPTPSDSGCRSESPHTHTADRGRGEADSVTWLTPQSSYSASPVGTPLERKPHPTPVHRLNYIAELSPETAPQDTAMDPALLRTSTPKGATRAPHAPRPQTLATPGLSALENSSMHEFAASCRSDELEDSELLNVPIIGYEVMEERARFTVYKIQINRTREENWFIFRRYSDFVRLNDQLLEIFPHFRLALPPKKWVGDNFDHEFLEDRKEGLQAFLRNVSSHREVSCSQPVRNFLCLDDPPGPHESIEESRAQCDALEEQVYDLRRELNEKDAKVVLLEEELALHKAEIENLRKSLRLERALNASRLRERKSPSQSSQRSESSLPEQDQTEAAQDQPDGQTEADQAMKEMMTCSHESASDEMVLQMTNRVLAAAEVHASHQGISVPNGKLPSECDKLSLVDRGLPTELSLVEGNNNSQFNTPEDHPEKYLGSGDIHSSSDLLT